MVACEVCGAECEKALVNACLACSLKPVIVDAMLGRQLRQDLRKASLERGVSTFAKCAQNSETKSQPVRMVDNRLSSKLSQLARRVCSSPDATG